MNQQEKDDPEVEKLIAEVLDGIEEALPKPPPSPEPKLVAREVKVSGDDPNYSFRNRGKVQVQVNIYERLYWNEVDRLMNPPIFGAVVSDYHPWRGLKED